MAAVTATTLSRYEVVASGGLTLGDRTYSPGARISLSPQQAYYLELSGAIRSLTGQVLDPLPEYVPPPVGPIVPTESNTLVGLTVSGLSTFVTIDNLVNLFPKLRPQRGERGDKGDKGDKGDRGYRGPSVVVNGHEGDSVTVTKDDVGLGKVENIAPDDLPVSRATVTAIAAAIASVLDQIASGGEVNIDTLAAIVATKASKSELTAAVGQLLGTASSAGSDLGKLEALVASARARADAVDLKVSGILAGASADVDTFLEVLNRFIAVESVEASLLSQIGTKADQSTVVALASATLDAVSGKMDRTNSALLSLLTLTADAQPWLPADPANYPASGGWFKDGDSTGYRLVRILPVT